MKGLSIFSVSAPVCKQFQFYRMRHETFKIEINRGGVFIKH